MLVKITSPTQLSRWRSGKFQQHIQVLNEKHTDKALCLYFFKLIWPLQFHLGHLKKWSAKIKKQLLSSKHSKNQTCSSLLIFHILSYTSTAFLSTCSPTYDTKPKNTKGISLSGSPQPLAILETSLLAPHQMPSSFLSICLPFISSADLHISLKNQPKTLSTSKSLFLAMHLFP